MLLFISKFKKKIMKCLNLRTVTFSFYVAAENWSFITYNDASVCLMNISKQKKDLKEFRKREQGETPNINVLLQ